MNISRTSWHYRWLRWAEGKPHQCNTLCEYSMRFAWVTFAVICKWTVFAVGAAMVIPFAFYTFYLMVSPALKFFWPHLDFITDNHTYTGYFIWGFGLVLFALMEGFGKVSKQLGILSTALEDYREKKCTRIEFKD